MSEYKWSSYNNYINNEGITDTDFALEMMNNDNRKAVEAFIKFHAEQNDDGCLEIEDKIRLSDEEAKEFIWKEFGLKALRSLRILRRKIERQAKTTKKQGHIHKADGAVDGNKQSNNTKGIDRENRPRGYPRGYS